MLDRLPQVFHTANPVLCFAASGTGAMESAVANLVVPGEPAVVASCGKFGERWAELCDAYGAETVHLDVEWGEKRRPRPPRRGARGPRAAPRAPSSRPSRRPRPASSTTSAA